MNHRALRLSFTLVLAAFVSGALGPKSAAQTSSTASSKSGAPATSWKQHTPDGQPDLQGTWSNATITPLERPAALAGKAFFTDEELAQQKKELQEGEACRQNPSP